MVLFDARMALLLFAVMVVLLSDFDLPIQKPLKPSQWLCKQNAAYSIYCTLFLKMALHETAYFACVHACVCFQEGKEWK